MSESSSDKNTLKEMLENIVQPLKDQIDHRVKTPLVGSFILSWLVFNWEKIAVLFISKENIYTRLDKIANLPQINVPFWGQNYTNTLLLPLLSSLFLTMAVPYINRAINRWMHGLNLRNIKTNVELAFYSDIKSQEEITKIKIEKAAADKAQYESTLLINEYETLTKKINSSKTELKDFENNIEFLLQDESKLKKDISELNHKFGTYDAAKNKIEQLTQANRDNSVHLREAQDQVARVLRENSSLNGLINDMNARNVELQKINTQLNEQINVAITESTQNKTTLDRLEEQWKTVENSRLGELAQDAEILLYAEEILQKLRRCVKDGHLGSTPMDTYRQIEDTLTVVTDRKNELYQGYWTKEYPFPLRTLRQRLHPDDIAD